MIRAIVRKYKYYFLAYVIGFLLLLLGLLFFSEEYQIGGFIYQIF